MEYSLDDKAYSKGCLLCGSGIILDSCPEKTADAINCYLPLLKHGGIDLCTGSLAPSFSPSLEDLRQWSPTLSISKYSVQDPEFHLRMQRASLSNLGLADTLDLPLNAALTQGSDWQKISSYLQLLDYLIVYWPCILILLVLIKVISCKCNRSTVLHSTLT